MTSENANIDQLKKAWYVMGECLGIRPTPDSDPENLKNKKTALDRLRNQYRTLFAISLPMVFTSYLIFSRAVPAYGKQSLYLGIAYAAYFIITFIMDRWLWTGIGTIDPLKMSVSQVVEKSMFYRKRHLQFIAILIPIAVVLLGFTGYVFLSNIYFLSGIIVGAICGAILGIIQFRRFMDEYRKLSE